MGKKSRMKRMRREQQATFQPKECHWLVTFFLSGKFPLVIFSLFPLCSLFVSVMMLNEEEILLDELSEVEVVLSEIHLTRLGRSSRLYKLDANGDRFILKFVYLTKQEIQKFNSVIAQEGEGKVSLFYAVDEIVGVVGEDGEIIVDPESYIENKMIIDGVCICLLYTSPSPRDA